jgi:hypothetical protein
MSRYGTSGHSTAGCRTARRSTAGCTSLTHLVLHNTEPNIAMFGNQLPMQWTHHRDKLLVNPHTAQGYLHPEHTV